MKFTIFTPTFNRATLLPRLFQSLQSQLFNDFEWIIVDDGSTDNTSQVVQEFIDTNPSFKISYYIQPNLGKHIAINKGVSVAKGELFFIVDSDDFISEKALSIIDIEWELISGDDVFAGIVPNKCYIEGKTIGNPTYDQLDCSPYEFRYKFNQIGDKAEIIRTSIFKMYPFPNTVNEKFCPEALFFNKIIEYKLRYINKDLYFCQYLPDGLTAKIFQIRKESPINTCQCYMDMANLNVPFMIKVRACVNFYRFKRYTSVPVNKPNLSLFTLFFSKIVADIIYFLKDKNN